MKNLQYAPANVFFWINPATNEHDLFSGDVTPLAAPSIDMQLHMHSVYACAVETVFHFSGKKGIFIFFF
jgi:hypothetical protein